MTLLPYQDRRYVRFISERTGETLFEIKMLGGSLIVWGSHYRPDEFAALLAIDGSTGPSWAPCGIAWARWLCSTSGSTSTQSLASRSDRCRVTSMVRGAATTREHDLCHPQGSLRA